MSIKHIHEIESSIVKDAVGVTRKMLIPLEEAPNFIMRSFTIHPGSSMPNHTSRVEHEQFVLNGQARIGIGSEVFEVKKGSVISIPAEVTHWYTNAGDEPFVFLCLIPNKQDSTTPLQ